MTQRTSPQPAKQAAFKAFELFNIVVFTVGAKVSTTINVAMQFQDARGQNIAQIASCYVYLSDNANGSTLTATAATSNIVVGTNGVVLDTPVTEKEVHCLTNATGQLDLNIVQTASPQPYYLCVIMPDGSIAVSPLFTF